MIASTSATQVKICGITNRRDAVNCVEAGAHFLGFNFYTRSPRCVTPETARRIIETIRGETAGAICVGVFVDEQIETVQHIAREAKLDVVQLHGDESPRYCELLRPLEVIKAVRVTEQFRPSDAAQYGASGVLLDAWQANIYGGTGRTFDWSLAGATRPLVARLLLAGGLAPENVAEAVRRVRPFAVDVCSGVECAPGLKDAARVRRFIECVRSANDASKDV